MKSAKSTISKGNGTSNCVTANTSKTALNGAMTGAMIGVRFGPHGAIVGSIIGGVVGFIIDEVDG